MTGQGQCKVHYDVWAGVVPVHTIKLCQLPALHSEPTGPINFIQLLTLIIRSLSHHCAACSCQGTSHTIPRHAAVDNSRATSTGPALPLPQSYYLTITIEIRLRMHAAVRISCCWSSDSKTTCNLAQLLWCNYLVADDISKCLKRGCGMLAVSAFL